MNDILMGRNSVKRLAGILLLGLIAFLLAGCGNASVFDGSKAANETGFQMEYSILNKEETADLKLSEGEQLRVIFSHTAGNVDVTVGQDGKEPIYRGTKQDNAEFVLMIPESGVYHISVTGHQAKGKVSFTRIPAAE